MQEVMQLLWYLYCSVHLLLSTPEAVEAQFPKFSVSSPLTVSVDEPGNTIGVFVASVAATDSAEYLPILYSLGGLNPAFFKIDSSGTLVTNLGIDASEYGALSVTVTAKNSLQVVSTLSVNLLINDLNDHAPAFSPNQLTLSVSEATTSGALIATLQARDGDSGTNAVLTYSLISGNSDSIFSLHPSTGKLTLAQALDYERATFYSLQAKVSDAGSPPLTSVMPINITVLDVNDNAPTFNQSQYSYNIPESTPNGTVIGTMLVIDADSAAPNNVFSISLLDSVPFTVDPRNGTITVNGILDYETTTFFYVQVLAVDEGTNPLSSVANLRVNLLDVNDNAPIFDQTSYSSTIDYLSDTYTEVVFPYVYDPDKGLGGTFTCSLEAVSPSTNTKFRVDPRYGVVMTS
jgi:hypothetical protein